MLENLAYRILQDFDFERFEEQLNYLHDIEPVNITNQPMFFAVFRDEGNCYRVDIARAAYTILWTFTKNTMLIEPLEKHEYVIVHGYMQRFSEKYRDMYHTFMGKVRQILLNRVQEIFRDITVLNVYHDEVYFTTTNNIRENTFELTLTHLKFDVRAHQLQFLVRTPRLFVSVEDYNLRKFTIFGDYTREQVNDTHAKLIVDQLVNVPHVEVLDKLEPFQHAIIYIRHCLLLEEELPYDHVY